MKELFKDIPLDKVSSTLIIQPPCSAIIMSQYLLMAREQGIPWENLIGTIMNCAFTQLVGPTFQANTAFFPIDLQVKIALDVIEYLIPRCPRWNIINVNSRNIRETGVDAVEEVAFVLSLACDYIRGLLDRGLPIDTFAPRMAFFSAAHLDLFEEVAKFRAMRRVWARLLWQSAYNQRYVVPDRCSDLCTALSAQEPMNNVCGQRSDASRPCGTQSIHTTALMKPTVCLRKKARNWPSAQQIIA
jgi:methylmalonyl-CoA mutase N-terminal domain/subunit